MANSRIPDLTNYTNPDAANDVLPIWDNTNSQTKKITRNNFLGISGSPVGTSDSQALSNKTLGNTNTITVKDSTNLVIQNASDTSKQARFDASGITTATTRTFAFPDANTTLVGTNTTQTLTNKTLTAPVISGGSIDNATVTVDSVAGHSSANTGTIYGIAVASSKISGSVLSNTTVTADKLNTGATSSTVATSETTGSVSYTDLATSGPAVTVTIGVNGLALVIIGSQSFNSGVNDTFMSFAISGATTLAAADANSRISSLTTSSKLSWAKVVTGLTAGSNTFTAKYRVAAGTGTFVNRDISVIPL